MLEIIYRQLHAHINRDYHDFLKFQLSTILKDIALANGQCHDQITSGTPWNMKIVAQIISNITWHPIRQISIPTWSLWKLPLFVNSQLCIHSHQNLTRVFKGFKIL